MSKKLSQAFLEQLQGLLACLVEKDNVLTVQELSEALAPLADLLGIARIQMQVVVSQETEVDRSAVAMVYDRVTEREPEASSGVVFSHATGKDSSVFYTVFPCAGQPAWTEEQKMELGELILVVFFSQRCARLLSLADYASSQHGFSNYNMAFFFSRAEYLLMRHQLSAYDVCQINISYFSLINQRLGHETGTKVMVAFIRRLDELIGSTGIVGRIGSDNFMCLYERRLRDLVIDYLEDTQVLYDEANGRSVQIECNAGFYAIPEELKQVADMVDKANIALSASKKELKKKWSFYDEPLRERLSELQELESQLAAAFEKEEFQVYYQPKVSLKDYSIVGAEALCRWVKDGKVLPPVKFIPILEQGMGICELDYYMLEHVCADIRRWLDEGKKPVKISVNLSRMQIGEPRLVNKLVSIIDYYEIPHEYLEIELTETLTEVEFQALKRIVSELQQENISASVDDFGVGYSSLRLISEIPWNVLKIDRCFLQKDENERRNKRILTHIITLAQDLGIECIAEGVETLENIQMLKENNCFLAQGFYFDKPLPREEFEKKL